MSDLSDWFSATTAGYSLNEVAKRSGIAVASLHRYTQNWSFTAEAVAKVARAFEASIPDALVAHGVVEASELASVAIAGTLSDATDQQLLDEIARRLALAPEGESEVFDSLNSGGNATVHYPDFSGDTVDDERAVASDRSDDNGEDTDYDD